MEMFVGSFIIILLLESNWQNCWQLYSSVDIFEMSFLAGIESIFLVHSPPLAGTKDTDKNYEARLLVGRIIT